jgi:predicted methyltransferase
MPISSKLQALLSATVLVLAAIPASTPGWATTMPTPTTMEPALSAAIANPARTPAMVARDPVRHPGLELSFFGLKPGMTVVELWPGGGYWTEILGAYLAARGHYYVALPAPGDKGEDAGVVQWRSDVAAQGKRLGVIHETMLGAGKFDIAPPGSADLVLTFRNLHNWMDGGYGDAVLAACFRALKSGGILGIEEHRGRSDRPQDPRAKSGYVRQDYTIDMAKRAGFVLVGSSEMNANPRDTKDWVDGVWTLPPTLSQKDKDRDRYIAIGEADNFVLKFRKP